MASTNNLQSCGGAGGRGWMNRVSELRSHPNESCEILSVDVKSNGVCVYSQGTVLMNTVTCTYGTVSIKNVGRNDVVFSFRNGEWQPRPF